MVQLPKHHPACAHRGHDSRFFFVIDVVLRKFPARLAAGNEAWAWVPFGAKVGIFMLAFVGLAYSLYPYLVVERITIWQAASAPESLRLILAGMAIVLPAIIGHTVFSYKVFWGKARKQNYS